MKNKLNLVLGIFGSLCAIGKLVTCPTCEDQIMWISVPGYVYIIFWSALSAILFHGVYKANRKDFPQA